MLKKACLIFFIFLFFIFPNKIFANLYINEFSSGTSDSDWVEIYNSDSNSLSLSDYILRDSTSSNKILLTGEIIGFGFAVFNWSNKLNNDGDTIRLLLKSDESSVDQVIYGKDGDIVALKDTQTVGRIPDGLQSLFHLSVSSKGSSNNSASSVPNDTPTPTITPTSTRTPTPTKTPTQKPVPTSKPTPIATKLPTSTVKTEIPSSRQIALDDESVETSAIAPTSILGVSTQSATPTPNKEKEKNMEILGDESSKISLIILISGVFFGACGILVFFIYKKKGSNESV
ncbi:MAG: lamin tail domain-containing protein [Patescibacteria group bacterium]